MAPEVSCRQHHILVIFFFPVRQPHPQQKQSGLGFLLCPVFLKNGIVFLVSHLTNSVVFSFIYSLIIASSRIWWSQDTGVTLHKFFCTF